MKIRFITSIVLILLVNTLFGQVLYNETNLILSHDYDSKSRWNEKYYIFPMENNGFMISWITDKNLDKPQICMQKFNKYLNPIDSLTFYDINQKRYSSYQIAAQFYNKNYIICWDRYCQIFNKIGNPVGDKIEITGYQDHSLKILPNNNFVIAWRGYDETGACVYWQLFDEIGNRIGDLQGAENTLGPQIYTKTYVFPDGKYIVSWDSHGYWGENRGFYGQIYTINGERIGTNIRLSEKWRDGYDTEILILSNELFVLKNSEDMQLFNVEGKKIGNPIQREDDKILNLDGEKWMSVWIYNMSLYGQIYDYQGNEVGTKKLLKYPWRSVENIDFKNDGIILLDWKMNQYGDDIIDFMCNGLIIDQNGNLVKHEFEIFNYKKIERYRNYHFFKTLSDSNYLVIREQWVDKGNYSFSYNLYAKMISKVPVENKLSNFKIIYPAMDETVLNAKPNFKWNRANLWNINLPWEMTYNVYISDSEEFIDPLIYKNIEDTTFQLPDTLDIGSVYYWKVQAVNWEYDSLWCSNVNGFFVSHDAEVGIDEDETILSEFSLSQNYPNPFNNSTMINYQLAMIGEVRLSIFDMQGREITTLVNENQNVGNYSVQFDGSGLSSGIYFYRLSVGSEFVETRKMVLLK